MISGQGTSLQGATLTEGNTHVIEGEFIAPTVIECFEDGDIEITWKSGATKTITLTSGWVNPISCKSVKVISGSFNIAWV